MSRWLRKLAPPAAIVISAVVALGLVYRAATIEPFGMDFGVYWRAANEPLAEVYRPRPALNFPYVPTMLLWIAPLSKVPFWAAYAGWVALSVAAFVRSCRAHLSKREIGLALISLPMVYCLLTGQVSAFLTALLLWACRTPNRIAAGIALAVIASIKPQLVLLAPLLLLATRDWRALGSSALALAVLIAISLLAYGVGTWENWIGSLDHFQEIIVRNGVLTVMVTPAAAAQLWGLPPLPFMALGAAVGVWLVIHCRNQAPLFQATAIAAGSLLSAPYAVLYDLVAVVPFLAWSIFRGSMVSALVISSLVSWSLNSLPLWVAAFRLLREPTDHPRAP
ncbi:MAG TPA: glycosyltransferase family 87 protein [Sphingomicrobium sp.]|nr:glycosyltransferase family 87 protein [Sphingomicrobium sp.]